MTIEMTSHLGYLIDQIRSNLLPFDRHEVLKETPCAHAWLLTTLAIYGEQFHVLIDLYRLFREQNSYILLAFIIEHILQYHFHEIEKNNYLQQEFQLIFSHSSITNEQFSYSRLYSLLSISTRDRISSFLLHQWSHELEENLSQSLPSLNQCREKALACLSLSSSSISSILQLILNTENQIGFNTKLTSLNILRALFVQDLLPVVLNNPQKLDIQAHVCHKWLIYAMEFYIEYWIVSFQTKKNHVRLEGNDDGVFSCENPLEEIEKLIHLALSIQPNFNWQQFLTHQGNENHRQQLLELRLLINRTPNSTIHCPLECFIYCISFPIYIQSILNLSKFLSNEGTQDYLFLSSTASIQTLVNQQKDINHFDLMENFYLFIECLNFLQQSQTSACLKLYQEIIDKIHLMKNIPIYSRLLKIFYFYYLIQKSKNPKEINANKTIIIDDTPQSPTMQDDGNTPINSPLLCPDLESFIQQLNDHSLESRLQLCSLFSISHPPRQTVSFCIDTLIYLQENSSTSHSQEQSLFSISSDYCFIPHSYAILFDYLLDLILPFLPPTLILFQIKQQQPQYPSTLFPTFSPPLLRYIYDQKLLGQLLKYIQTSKSPNDRRWLINHTNKRKHNEDENKITDEQFIEKIIQHVSNITQWSDEQRRHAIYTYIIDERQTLLQAL